MKRYLIHSVVIQNYFITVSKVINDKNLVPVRWTENVINHLLTKYLLCTDSRFQPHVTTTKLIHSNENVCSNRPAAQALP